MYSGQVDEWNDRLKSLKKVDAPLKLYVPGNHDYYPFYFEGLASAQLRKQAGVKMLRTHEPFYVLPNGMTLLSIPYVTGLPGWAYNVEDDWLYDWLIQTTDGQEVDIVVSHAPMYQMLDAIHPLENTPDKRNHVGSWATNKWFHERLVKPLLWINGHIHESYGHMYHEGCHFYNVSHCDKKYDQTNDPVLIEL